MLRPNTVQMSHLPVPPLNVEEVKFWLYIMQEHALFIKLGLPCDKTDFIDECQKFYKEFGGLYSRTDKCQSEKKFSDLVIEARSSIKEFHRFKRYLLHQMLVCKLRGSIFPTMLDHMAREAEYVLRLFEKMKDGKTALQQASKTQETAFWLRIMSDHAGLMSHLLDPSERTLVQTTQGFAQDFDVLFLQGRDFVSMLHKDPEDIASYSRFVRDVRVATLRLRDFKKAARDMLEECKAIALISPQLADHVRREAEHFLMILAMIEKGMLACVDENDYGSEMMEEMHEMVEEHHHMHHMHKMPPVEDMDEMPDIDEIDDMDETVAEFEQQQEYMDESRPQPMSEHKKSMTAVNPVKLMPEEDDDDFDDLDDDLEEEFDDSITQVECAPEAAKTKAGEAEQEVPVYKPPKYGKSKEKIDWKDSDEEVEAEVTEIKVKSKMPQNTEPSFKQVQENKQPPAPKEQKYKWSGKWPRPLGKPAE